jgi:hypothetical protein
MTPARLASDAIREKLKDHPPEHRARVLDVADARRR